MTSKKNRILSENDPNNQFSRYLSFGDGWRIAHICFPNEDFNHRKEIKNRITRYMRGIEFSSSEAKFKSLDETAITSLVSVYKELNIHSAAFIKNALSILDDRNGYNHSTPSLPTVIISDVCNYPEPLDNPNIYILNLLKKRSDKDSFSHMPERIPHKAYLEWGGYTGFAGLVDSCLFNIADSTTNMKSGSRETAGKRRLGSDPDKIWYNHHKDIDLYESDNLLSRCILKGWHLSINEEIHTQDFPNYEFSSYCMVLRPYRSPDESTMTASGSMLEINFNIHGLAINP